MNSSTVLVRDLEALFERRTKKPLGLLLSWAEAAGEVVTARALFCDENGRVRPKEDYGLVQLCEKWLGLEEALSFVESLGTERAPKPFGGLVPQGGWERSVNGYISYSGGAEWRLSANANGSKQVPLSAPMVAPRLRPFRSVGEGIERFVFGPQFPEYGGQLRHKDSLLVILPDCRGRIAQLEWTGARLFCEVQTVDLSQLELQLLVKREASEAECFFVQSQIEQFDAELAEDAEVADVFLVHTSGDLLAVASVRPGARIKDPLEPLGFEEQARMDISAGESESVEFKPFVEPKSEKESELLETVVAFANSSGGRLYVGVGKNGCPEGEAALGRMVKTGEKQDACSKYLDSLFRERIKPVPPFRIVWVNYLQKPVAMVLVEQGENTPYSYDANHVFIRKGASNFRPDPQTEMPKLYERHAANDFFPLRALGL